MNNRQKLKLFWKIARRINKKFCRNKLEIKDIVFFKRRKHSAGFYYSVTKVIGLRESCRLNRQIEILCHELSHAWQLHFHLNFYNRKLDRIKRLTKKAKMKAMHDKKGKKMCMKFIKFIDKKIKVNV